MQSEKVLSVLKDAKRLFELLPECGIACDFAIDEMIDRIEKLIYEIDGE